MLTLSSVVPSPQYTLPCLRVPVIFHLLMPDVLILRGNLLVADVTEIRFNSILDIEHGSFTPFSGLYKTGGKGVSEELIAIKMGEHCEKPMSCHSYH